MFSQFMRKTRRGGAPAAGPDPRARGRAARNGEGRSRHRPSRSGAWLLRLAACALLPASCLNPPLEPQPLTVSLTASQESAAVGQEIRFRYESRGTNLSQTVVEYGTGDMETVPFIYTGGAPVNINSQAGHFDYAYEEPGTYVARATVSTVAGDSRSAMVTVEISGP